MHAGIRYDDNIWNYVILYEIMKVKVERSKITIQKWNWTQPKIEVTWEGSLFQNMQPGIVHYNTTTQMTKAYTRNFTFLLAYQSLY